MITNTFYSKNNKNAIKGVLNEDTLSRYNKHLDAKYDHIVNETMDYVFSQIKPMPPTGMSKDDYLLLINKKVYAIVISLIEKDTEFQKKAKSTAPAFTSPEDIIKMRETFNQKQDEIQGVMEYPRPTVYKKEIDKDGMETRLEQLETERSPVKKLQPVSFLYPMDTQDNVNKAEITRNFEELAKNRKNEEIVVEKFTQNYMGNGVGASFQDGIDASFQDGVGASFQDGDSLSTPIHLLNRKEAQTDYFMQRPPPNNIEMRDSSVILAPSLSNQENFMSHLANKNNDIQTPPQQQNSLEFSNAFAVTPNNLYKEPAFRKIEKKYFVLFDSMNRDLYLYPNQTSFQIKFAPDNNNFVYHALYDEHNTLLLNEKTISMGNDSDINIQETFDNIQSITCTSASVPTNPTFYETNPTTAKTVYSNIYNEQYLYLVVPEIKGPYRGGNTITSNAFSKLIVDPSSNVHGPSYTNSFTNLLVNDMEIFEYSPVSAGKIDKMTLNLMNKNGNFYNFGIDKLYVESIEPGTQRTNSYCGTSFLSTILILQQSNPEYAKYCSHVTNMDCTYLNSHPITTADKVYFYDTFPTQDQVVFLEDTISISRVKYVDQLFIHIHLSYKKDGKNVPVLLQQIIPPALYKNYYVVLVEKHTNQSEYFAIDGFTATYTSLISTEKLKKAGTSYRIGIAQRNLRGQNTDDSHSLFSRGGYYICNVDHFKIEINFPYEKLPPSIKNNYNNGDIFLIQDKMQISYNFQITISVKDYVDVHSKLNESGNN